MSARRDRLILVLLLSGQFALVSSQGGERQQTVAESTLTRLLGPFASAVTATQRAAEDVPARAATRSSLRLENERLRAELEVARQQQVELVRVRGELARLAVMLDYRDFTGTKAQVADVVYADYASWLRTLVIRGGRGARFEVDQPVVSTDGLVGRIVGVAGPWAKVQLLTDRVAAVGAQLARTRRQGVVRGSGSGQLHLDYLSRQAEIEIGDLVQTAGIDGVYPRGLMIGSVVAIGTGGELFHDVEIQPAVDFSRLDQVLVLERSEIPEVLRRPQGEDSP